MTEAPDTRALTDQQEAFALAYASNGARGADAARSAGFSAKSAGKYASQLLDKPHVQKAIQRAQRRILSDLASIALNQARAMLLDPKTPAGARVDLVRTTLDRAGLGPLKAEQEDHEDLPLNKMSFAQLAALVLRPKPGPASEELAGLPCPVDAVVERLEPPP